MLKATKRLLESKGARIGAALSAFLFALWAGAAPGWDSIIALIMASAAYLYAEIVQHHDEPDKNEKIDHTPKSKQIMSKPLVVANCQWDRFAGVWFDPSFGIAYCHKCAVADVKSPMRFVGENDYRCPICHAVG